MQKFCVLRVSTRASVLCVIKDHFGFNSWLLWCSLVEALFTRREEDPSIRKILKGQNNSSFGIHVEIFGLSSYQVEKKRRKIVGLLTAERLAAAMFVFSP